jgi:hypothetical protein
MKLILLSTMLLWIITTSLAQDIESVEFFNRVRTGYYNLNETDLTNFSFWLTSDRYLALQDSNAGDMTNYPLEIIWVKPDRLFFLKNGLGHDSLIYPLQQEIRGLLLDWQRFCAGSPVSSMPDIFELQTKSDTIEVYYSENFNTGNIDTRMKFGINGKCLLIETKNETNGQTIKTYPEYANGGLKWICTGWKVRIFTNDKITSGFAVKVLNKKIDNYLLPFEFKLLVQSADKEGEIFTRIYRTMNHRINRDLQVLKK